MNCANRGSGVGTQVAIFRSDIQVAIFSIYVFFATKNKYRWFKVEGFGDG